MQDRTEIQIALANWIKEFVKTFFDSTGRTSVRHNTGRSNQFALIQDGNNRSSSNST